MPATVYWDNFYQLEHILSPGYNFYLLECSYCIFLEKVHIILNAEHETSGTQR